VTDFRLLVVGTTDVLMPRGQQTVKVFHVSFSLTIQFVVRLDLRLHGNLN
jgi:hypothetical protein